MRSEKKLFEVGIKSVRVVWRAREKTIRVVFENGLDLGLDQRVVSYIIRTGPSHTFPCNRHNSRRNYRHHRDFQLRHALLVMSYFFPFVIATSSTPLAM